MATPGVDPTPCAELSTFRLSHPPVLNPSQGAFSTDLVHSRLDAHTEHNPTSISPPPDNLNASESPLHSVTNGTGGTFTFSRANVGSQSLPRDLPGHIHLPSPDGGTPRPGETVRHDSNNSSGGHCSVLGGTSAANPSPLPSPRQSTVSSPVEQAYTPPHLRVIGPYSGPARMMSPRVLPPSVIMAGLPPGAHGFPYVPPNSPSARVPAPAVPTQGAESAPVGALLASPRAADVAVMAAGGASIAPDLGSTESGNRKAPEDHHQQQQQQHQQPRVIRPSRSGSRRVYSSAGAVSPRPGGASSLSFSSQTPSPTGGTADDGNAAGDIAAYCPLATGGSFCRRVGVGGGSGMLSPISPAEPLRLGPLVQALSDGNVGKVREAARSVRAALKGCKENKDRLMQACGVEPLVRALNVADDVAVEHATTAIFHVCREDGAGEALAGVGGLDALVRVLGRAGEAAAVARENSAATIFCLASASAEHRDRLSAAGAVPLLVGLLRRASSRGRKDASLALFSLLRAPGAVRELVECGGVRALLALLQAGGEAGVEEKAMAVLVAVARTPEGQAAIKGEEGGLLTLVEVLELSSQRAREDAVAALLLLCSRDKEALRVVCGEGVVPAVRKLCRSESRRVIERAQALLELMSSNGDPSSSRTPNAG